MCTTFNSKFNYLWSFWNVNMAWNGFSKMAVAIFSHYFSPNPLKWVISLPMNNKIPVAWNFCSSFSYTNFLFEIYTVLKEDDIKNVSSYSFFQLPFEPKYFTGAISRLWRFVWNQKTYYAHNFSFKKIPRAFKMCYSLNGCEPQPK